MEILTIILAILKWIGIILLSLLAFIFIILIIILLCPIRYQVEGAYDKSVSVRAKVSWFLGILKVQVSYDKDLKWSVSILGFRILPKKEAYENSSSKTVINKKRKKAGESIQSAKGESEPTENAEASGKKEKEQQNTVSVETNPTDSDTEKKEEKEQHKDDNNEPFPESTEKVSGFQSFLEKLSVLPEKIEAKIQSICDKIKEIKENADHYLKILKREEVQRLLKKVIRMLGKMLMHIRPRKFQVIAHVGMEDPATTGKIMSIQGLMYPWIAERIVIFPYFEEKKLEANFYIAGHTILGVLLFLVLRVVIHKDVLTLIRLLRKKEVSTDGRA